MKALEDVRPGSSEPTHHVPWKHFVQLANFLCKAKEAQRREVREIAQSEAAKGRPEKRGDRLYAKVMPGNVPGTQSDPLRVSPIETKAIALYPDFLEIAQGMSYDARTTLLFANTCAHELTHSNASLLSIQEAINKFVRMHPRSLVRNTSP